MTFATPVTAAVRAAAVAAFQAGEPATVVAARFNVTPPTVRKWSRDAGNPHRTPGPASHPNRDDALRDYRNGVAPAVIATRYGVNRTTVHHWITAAGITPHTETRREETARRAAEHAQIREAAIAAYLAGEPLTAIADQYGYSATAITRCVLDAGHPVRSRPADDPAVAGDPGPDHLTGNTATQPTRSATVASLSPVKTRSRATSQPRTPHPAPPPPVPDLTGYALIEMRRSYEPLTSTPIAVIAAPATTHIPEIVEALLTSIGYWDLDHLWQIRHPADLLGNRRIPINRTYIPDNWPWYECPESFPNQYRNWTLEHLDGTRARNAAATEWNRVAVDTDDTFLLFDYGDHHTFRIKTYDLSRDTPRTRAYRRQIADNPAWHLALTDHAILRLVTSDYQQYPGYDD
jgi:transposase-like protein